ncbi:MAG: sulfur carrier protein ThiS [Ignavibacteria bacterium]
MNIKLNGENKTINSKIILIDFLKSELNKTEFGGVAIAKNGTIVPRSKWESTEINDNDDIEIVHAVQGG